MLLKQIHQSVYITKGKIQSNKEQFLQPYKCALPLLEVGSLKKTPGDGRKYTSEVFSDLLTVFLNMHDSPAISEGVYYMDGSDQEVFPTEQSQRAWMLLTQRQTSDWPSIGPAME